VQNWRSPSLIPSTPNWGENKYGAIRLHPKEESLQGCSRLPLAIPNERPSPRAPCKPQTRQPVLLPLPHGPTNPRHSRFPGVAAQRKLAATLAPPHEPPDRGLSMELVFAAHAHGQRTTSGKSIVEYGEGNHVHPAQRATAGILVTWNVFLSEGPGFCPSRLRTGFHFANKIVIVLP
jgi:hypothetical protein